MTQETYQRTEMVNSSYEAEIMRTSERHIFRKENYTNWNQVLYQQTP